VLGAGVESFSSRRHPQPCGAGAKTFQVDVTFEDIAV
jgi:hypothetical protein